MTLTIRERCQRVTHQRLEKGLNLRELAAATGLSRSAVHRHKQAIARRNLYPESSWWETEAGSAWLKRLVLGMVYYFGLKQGVGHQALSEFLKALRLEQHVGSSPSCLRRLKQSMRAEIMAYKAAQKENCVLPPGSGICVGGDETLAYFEPSKASFLALLKPVGTSKLSNSATISTVTVSRASSPEFIREK